MPSRAMRLLSPTPHERRAGQVLGPRDRLKVVRANTAPDPAKVIEIKPFWDRANIRFVADTVRQPHPACHTKSAVTVPVDCSFPSPASTRLLQLRFESFDTFAVEAQANSRFCDMVDTFTHWVLLPPGHEQSDTAKL